MQAQSSEPDFTELNLLARGLRASKSQNAHAALKRFAERHSAQPGSQAVAARAALALGHYDYTNNRAAAAVPWLLLAAKDPLLADYAQYWLAQAERASGKPASALARLDTFRADHPGSLLAADAAEALAQVALISNQPEKTASLLAPKTTEARPDLLFLRAQAQERLGAKARAALDYSAVYYRFPLAPEARPAANRINAMRAALRAEFPAISHEWLATRVQAFLDARRCSEGKRELDRLGALLPEAARDPLRVRVANCMRRGAPHPATLEKLKVADAAADAERLFHLSQAWRAKRNEARMIAAVEEVALRHPSSPWTERALFAAGNYYWTLLDHPRAALYYQRLVQAFPASENARAAHWRAAWQAYLENSRRASARIEEHLRLFPGTPYTSNALYWLGRAAERSGQHAQARAFYARTTERFPQTYFGMVSAERLRELGAAASGGAADPEILAAIPEARPAVSLGSGLTADAEKHRAKARALASIELTALAEKELVAAYRETRAPALLLEAAQIAHDDSRYYNGVVIGRRLVPQLESRRLPELPDEVWRTVYPLAYGEGIHSTAALAGVDPMLVAGLIRQESVFQATAVSRAGAIGLMQVMPATGRQLARQLRLTYAKQKLYQPDFNLRLGTVHLAALVRNNGSIEAALAAYNAGQSRVHQWTAGRTYSEPAEFVETIPFTETREYVQIVLRNREVYRSLYGASSSASASSSSPGSR